jgi:hypothetical protein
MQSNQVKQKIQVLWTALALVNGIGLACIAGWIVKEL